MTDFFWWLTKQDRDTKIAMYFLTLTFLVSSSLVLILGIDRYSRYKIRELDVKIMELQNGRK